MFIQQASLAQLNDLVILFNHYMIFYHQPSAPEKYRAYLEQRLTAGEATVYIAYNSGTCSDSAEKPEGSENSDKKPIGFVLNYYGFSSVSLGNIIILNDLFVVPSHRQLGVATKLINCSIDLAKSVGAARVDLNTATDNHTAQALYEKIGFINSKEILSYSLYPDHQG
jgi:ribosomal protein S18 acetylase RimI-like enzyme